MHLLICIIISLTIPEEQRHCTKELMNTSDKEKLHVYSMAFGDKSAVKIHPHAFVLLFLFVYKW